MMLREGLRTFASRKLCLTPMFKPITAIHCYSMLTRNEADRSKVMDYFNHHITST